MAKKWDELDDEDQKNALNLLHLLSHSIRKSRDFNPSECDLIETAINTLDNSRRKFQKPGMTTYGAGVVVILFNYKEEILLGKRKGSHGAGTWSLPGGKIEFTEGALLTAARELEEETGISISDLRFRPREWVDNVWVDPKKGQQHWISLFVETELAIEQSPKVMEPEKCEEWRWVNPFALIDGPLPLFPPLESYLRKYPVQFWDRFRNRTHRT
jgi:8-oxo-dGTP diphosphatase